MSQKVICFCIHLTSAHQHGGKVINGLGPCSRVILHTTFSGSWDKATHWFLRESIIMGYLSSLLSLANLSPHRGLILEAPQRWWWMEKCEWFIDTKVSVQPIMTKLCFYKSLSSCYYSDIWQDKLDFCWECGFVNDCSSHTWFFSHADLHYCVYLT